MTAILPGSYDPITVGHLNIIERASGIADSVIVLMAINPDKNYRFSKEQRLCFIRDAVKHLPRVKVDFTDGYVVDYASRFPDAVFIKGIRNEADYSYEADMAKFNSQYASEHYAHAIETLLLPADEKYREVSSTAVRNALDTENSVKMLVPNEEFYK